MLGTKAFSSGNSWVELCVLIAQVRGVPWVVNLVYVYPFLRSAADSVQKMGAVPCSDCLSELQSAATINHNKWILPGSGTLLLVCWWVLYRIYAEIFCSKFKDNVCPPVRWPNRMMATCTHAERQELRIARSKWLGINELIYHNFTKFSSSSNHTISTTPVQFCVIRFDVEINYLHLYTKIACFLSPNQDIIFKFFF